MNVITQKFKLTKLVLISGLVFGMSACNTDDLAPPPPPPAVNNAPTIISTEITIANEGQPYTYTLTATDADADALTYSATESTWLTLDADTGVLSGIPASTDVGDNAVTLTVSDGTDSDTQVFTIVVTAALAENVAPTFTSTPSKVGAVDEDYSYTATGDDLNFDDITFSSVTLPAWATFNTDTGVLSGTPEIAGDYSVELTLSDSIETVSQTFTIDVTGPAVVTVELVVFENMPLQGWQAWTDSGGPFEVVTVDGDPDRDQATKFTLTKASVAGFTARETGGAIGGMPFDASGLVANGQVTFELLLLAETTVPVSNWFFKVEAGGGDKAREVTLSSSLEGHAAPELNVWQTYTFPLATLASGGSLDLSGIDLFMVFPSYGDAAGASYLVDNFKIVSVVGGDNGPVVGETEMFYDDVLADSLVYNSYNPDGFVSYNADVAEDGRGNVIEIVKTGATGNFYFEAPNAFDLTPYEEAGELVFDLNVSSLEAGVDLYVKFDSGWPNVSDYIVTLPTTGEWATVRISVADILANGNSFGDGTANPSNILNVFVVEPTGVMTFKLDNVRLEIPGTDAPIVAADSVTFYTDVLADSLVYNSYNPDGFVSYNADVAEDGRGNVIEIVKTGATGNFYFEAPNAFDLTPYEEAGELVFDLNVSSLEAGVDLYVKFDSGWPNVSDYIVTLPTTGEWATVRIPVADILANGNSFGDGTANPSNILNVFVVEPTGVMTFKLDNVRLEIPGTDAPVMEAETFYDDVLADSLVYNSYNPDGFVSYNADVAEDGRGNVIEIVKTGATGNFYFEAPNAFDITPYEEAGELVFDLNVSSLEAGVDLYVKFDSGWPNVSDYIVALPTTGEWATVRISVADILANGNSFGDGTANPSNILNVFVVEPTGVMTFKLDNIRIEK
jgi:catechol 2,3-dioxygenase-like lactoylglutathione lyase family enzyme